MYQFESDAATAGVITAMRARRAALPRFVSLHKGEGGASFLIGCEGISAEWHVLAPLRKISAAYGDLLAIYASVARSLLIDSGFMPALGDLREAWRDVGLQPPEWRRENVAGKATPHVVDFVDHAFDDAGTMFNLLPILRAQLRVRAGR